MLNTTLITDNLKIGISFVHHAVSSRSPLPILTNFLIEAEKGKLTISATDLEIGIQVVIPAKIESEGRVAVPAKTFLDLINSIDEEKIELEEKEKKLHLRTKRTKTSFPTQQASEFPSLFESKGEIKTEMKAKEFEEALSIVVFAAAQDTTRPALSGILIKSEARGTNMVATDGYRLSLKNSKSAEGAKGHGGLDLLISARVIKEVLGAGKNNDNIKIYSAEANNQVIFEFGDTIVVGRLIEAEYPDYQKIIPEEKTTSVSFDRTQALSAVRSSSVIAREAANIIKMTIGKKDITFSASATSAGENEVVIDAKLDGEENEIAFNARYLQDLFSSLEEDNLVFEMTGPLNPGVFKIEKDKSFLHLIMPIRVQD